MIVSTLFLMVQSDVGSGLYSLVWRATFGSALGISQLIELAGPLIIAGCAVAVARRMGLWNVGVEGQLVMGAFLATLVAFGAPELPGPLLIPLMLAAGFAGGAAWALVPALMRAYLNVNEIITGLMLNFAASFWLIYWVAGPWRERGSAQVLSSRLIPTQAWSPTFDVGSVVIGFGFVFALVVALVLATAARFTLYGFRMSLVGAEDRTAAYTGSNIRRMRLQVLTFSGGLGGLVGVLVELDTIHRFSPSLSSNTGYMGIVVAVLAANSPGACLLAGLLVAFVVAGADSLRLAGVPFDVVLLLSGFILMLAASADVLARYRVHHRPRQAQPMVRPQPDTEAAEALLP